MNQSLSDNDVGPLPLTLVDSVFPESGSIGTYSSNKVLRFPSVDKQSSHIEKNPLRDWMVELKMERQNSSCYKLELIKRISYLNKPDFSFLILANCKLIAYILYFDSLYHLQKFLQTHRNNKDILGQPL